MLLHHRYHHNFIFGSIDITILINIMKYHITWWHFLGVLLVHIFCFDKHLCKSLQKSVVFIRDLFLTFLISYLFIFIDKRDCILETSEIVIRDMYNELHRGVTYAKVRIAIPGTAKWAQISGHFCLFVVYFTHISPLYSDRHHYLFLRFLLFTPLT